MKKLLLILPILFEAISEGLYLHGDKVVSKQIQVLLIASWFLVVFVFAWEAICIDIKSKLKLLKLLGGYVLVYVLLRIVFFNYAHNIAADLPLNYIGTVSIIDRMITIVGIIPYYILQGFSAIGVYLLIRK